MSPEIKPKNVKCRKRLELAGSRGDEVHDDPKRARQFKRGLKRLVSVVVVIVSSCFASPPSFLIVIAVSTFSPSPTPCHHGKGNLLIHLISLSSFLIGFPLP